MIPDSVTTPCKRPALETTPMAPRKRRVPYMSPELAGESIFYPDPETINKMVITPAVAATWTADKLFYKPISYDAQGHPMILSFGLGKVDSVEPNKNGKTQLNYRLNSLEIEVIEAWIDEFIKPSFVEKNFGLKFSSNWVNVQGRRRDSHGHIYPVLHIGIKENEPIYWYDNKMRSQPAMKYADAKKFAMNTNHYDVLVVPYFWSSPNQTFGICFRLFGFQGEADEVSDPGTPEF